MITSDIRAKYKRVSSEERHGFNKWLQGCVLVGSILGAGFVAWAVAGLRSPQSDAVMRLAPSVQEQHELAHLKNLPAHPLEDMTFVFTADHLAQPSLSVSSSDNTAKQCFFRLWFWDARKSCNAPQQTARIKLLDQ